jgi:peptide/nickel transport system permease protein
MHTGGWFDKISGWLVFSFWSIPSFFTGTLLLVFFSNPDFLDWFPTGGVKDPSLFDPSWPVWKRIFHYLPYLVLPSATYTLTALAFLSRQVRAGVQVEMQKDYIRTARAKGVSENKIVTRHAFRNSLIPLITILGQYLPAVFGGSVIIETIFSIPGMGFEIYESIISNDYPMIVTVFTLFGFMTMLGYLLSDIGYALADPRIRFTGKKS